MRIIDVRRRKLAYRLQPIIFKSLATPKHQADATFNFAVTYNGIAFKNHTGVDARSCSQLPSGFVNFFW